jgi:hypothetical protein
MLEPFEHHDLPQRARAVKPMGIEVGDPVIQLGIPTGVGQRGATDVVAISKRSSSIHSGRDQPPVRASGEPVPVAMQS